MPEKFNLPACIQSWAPSISIPTLMEIDYVNPQYSL